MDIQKSPPSPSALLSFAAANVRSCRDEVTLSLLSTRLARKDVRRGPQTRSAAPVGVLPAAGIFGANASGKSALLSAMADMRRIVADSFRSGSRSSGIDRNAFALDDASSGKPSRFEVDLILHGVRWLYGFEIDDERVLGEYAYHYPKGRQALVFDRTPEEIRFGPPFRKAGRTLKRFVRDNALLLSVAGAADDEHIAPLYLWFQRNLLLAQTANRASRAVRTAELVKQPETKERVMALVHAAHLGVCGIERADIDPEVAERQQSASRVLRGEEGDPNSSDEDSNIVFADTVRLKHRTPNGAAGLDPRFESEGTKVWVGLIGVALDALDGGHVLLADELDTSLHPHLVSTLVEMFQDPRLNPLCAQLIFNTHDVTLFGDSSHTGRGTLGRDQIWFAEKGRNGATGLYSLADFSPRLDEALGRRYIQGRYGAVPVINPGAVHAALEVAGR